MREHLGCRYSAAVLRIDVRGRARHAAAFGTVRSGAGAAPVFVDTRFDIASLTKLFVSSVALVAVADRRLALDVPLAEHLSEWRASAHAPITLRMLLAHTAGLRSGADYRTLFDRDVAHFALTQRLEHAPGTRVLYSDLGFIALGTLLSRVCATGLAAAVEATLRAAGASRTTYAVPAAERPATPATECDAWRGLVQGRVHDEKAHLMNGIAGHAGLFSDAADVARVGEWYLAALHGRRTPLDPGLAREAIREAAFDPVLRRGLGWALRTTEENSCGRRIAPDAFGHTGFTGTVIWCDPQRDASIVLLTNAVHFGRADLRAVRAAVCDAAIAALDRA